MLFLQYPNCSTCQKARKWLDAYKITYTERHIAEDNPSYDELKEWHVKSGLPLKKFFNTSGLLYKEMQLKDKLPAMSEEEQAHYDGRSNFGANVAIKCRNKCRNKMKGFLPCHLYYNLQKTPAPCQPAPSATSEVTFPKI